MSTKTTRSVAALRAHLTRARDRGDRKAAKSYRARITALRAGQPDPGAPAKKASGTPARSLAALRARRTVMIQRKNGHATRDLNKRIKLILIDNPKLGEPKTRASLDPQSDEARAKARDILATLEPKPKKAKAKAKKAVKRTVTKKAA